MSERMRAFREFQQKFGNMSSKMTLERYLAEQSRKTPNSYREIILVWFEDHPSMVEVSVHVAEWYVTEGGQPA